uniref:Ig-like domain-containing protein n=1 Tax=Scleropages formosus TaxID=113540 RepID=A0A8C9SAB4_SCLFO
MSHIVYILFPTDSPGMWTESWSHTESGGSVTIPCHYHQRYKEHVKYWCKGYTWSSCSTMVRSDSPQSKGEVSITDDPDKLVFNVTMRNLQENCSGTFWCGVEINGVPAYGAILVLNVTAGEGGSVTIPCYYDYIYIHHVKYWCKGYTWSSCSTMVRTDTPQWKVFYVTMRNLKEEDSGWYWCGVETGGIGIAVYLTALYLTVTPGKMVPQWCFSVSFSLFLFPTGNLGVWAESWMSALRGESVTIQCRYDQRYKHSVKYWCKWETWSSCSTMVRSGSPQRKGDVSIADDPDQLVFTVTMRNVQEKDAGTYWCGVDIGGTGTMDDSAYIYLTVYAGKMGLLWFS